MPLMSHPSPTARTDAASPAQTRPTPTMARVLRPPEWAGRRCAVLHREIIPGQVNPWELANRFTPTR